jgi:FHA domain
MMARPHAFGTRALMKDARYGGWGNRGGLENTGGLGTAGRIGRKLGTLTVGPGGAVVRVALPLPAECRYKVPLGRPPGTWRPADLEGVIMDDEIAHGSGAFQPLRLRLHPGDHIIDLTEPDVLLGRQSDADLRMPQPDVSRHHCRFQFTGDKWQIVDLESLNGVYVNGARIRRLAVIHPGDQIRICGIDMDVEDPANRAIADGPSEVLRDIAAALPTPTLSRRVA